MPLLDGNEFVCPGALAVKEVSHSTLLNRCFNAAAIVTVGEAVAGPEERPYSMSMTLCNYINGAIYSGRNNMPFSSRRSAPCNTTGVERYSPNFSIHLRKEESV